MTEDLPSLMWRETLRRLVYVLVLIFVVIFLFRLGSEPWLRAIQRWDVLLALVLSTGAGLFVQAQSFRSVLPSTRSRVAQKTLLHIWAMSAIVSIVAPLFAGVATRTALLMRSGIALKICLTTTSRQIWMGLEFSLLFAALTLPFTRFPYAASIAFCVVLFWFVLLSTRLWVSTRLVMPRSSHSNIKQLLYSLGYHIPSDAYPWFALQILLMSVTYYVGFNGMGAQLEWVESIALSSMTVILSLFVFVPNGLGITDFLWVYIAGKSGLNLEESVAIAVILRMSHLMAALSIIVLTWREGSRAKGGASI